MRSQALAHGVEVTYVDRVSIAIIRIARESIGPDGRAQELEVLGFQAGDVKQVRLIEQQRLTGQGMLCRPLTDLPRAQCLVIQPLVMDAFSTAVLCDGFAVLGLKDRLPGKVNVRLVVADVPNATLAEPCDELRPDGLRNSRMSARGVAPPECEESRNRSQL